MNLPQHIWLAVCWIIFGALHTILASDSIKNLMQSVMQKNFKFYRLGYSIIATLMITYILVLNFSIESVLLWQPFIIEKIVSVIAGVAGLSVMLICMRKYFFDLSGVNVFFRQVSVDKLQVNGLNKYVRHPLYSSTLLFAWSFFFWQPLLSNLISCISILVYTLIGIYFEEQKLVKTFGEDYKEYAAKVPMIIPGLV
ncbi:MAG TPA: isoprenylcysteine carboxylmethyltransferase family protein [Chitinophagaceae bacterium]